MFHRVTLIAVLLALLTVAHSVFAQELEGHAIVQSDGSLFIKNRVVRLYGIYIPPTNRQCRDWISPIRCDSRAVLALDFFVKGFIHCFEQAENPDGSIDAVCYRGRSSFDPGTDLAAYLLQRGWALALPNAPFEYHAMERIARSQELGVWGWTIDSITEPLYPLR
ncbi:MAG: nuclease-like protein [Thiohalocapsa sp.]|jgi:endonuclease YncB( thermonuclease family)